MDEHKGSGEISDEFRAQIASLERREAKARRERVQKDLKGGTVARNLAQEIVELQERLDACHDWRDDEAIAKKVLKRENAEMKADLAKAKSVGLALAKIVRWRAIYPQMSKCWGAIIEYAYRDACEQFPDLPEVLRSLEE